MELSNELNMLQDESGAGRSGQRATSFPKWKLNLLSVGLLAALGCAAETYAELSLRYHSPNIGRAMSVERLIGACAGSLLTLAIMKVYGRKFAAAAIATMYVLYFLNLWVLGSSQWIRMSEFFVGIGSGGIYAVIPTYLVEIAEENSRGEMGVIILLMKTFGVFMASSLALISQRWVEHFLSMVLAFIFLTASLWMPETPYFLISSGRRDKALRSLTRLRIDVVKAQQKLQVLEESTQDYARIYTTRCSRLFNREAMKPVAVAGGLMFLQIMGEPFIINIIWSLSPVVHDTSATSFIVFITLHVLMIFVLLFLVDRVQRRLLLILSAIGTAASYGAMALMQYNVYYYHHLVVRRIVEFILVLTHYLGQGCLPLIIFAELMPNRVRAVGFATFVCINSISTYIYLKIFEVYYVNMTCYLGVHCGFSILYILYVIFVLPETKGKVL